MRFDAERRELPAVVLAVGEAEVGAPVASAASSSRPIRQMRTISSSQPAKHSGGVMLWCSRTRRPRCSRKAAESGDGSAKCRITTSLAAPGFQSEKRRPSPSRSLSSSSA